MKTHLFSIAILTVGFVSCTESEEPAPENFEANIELSEIRSWEINRPDIIPRPVFSGFLHDESLLVADISLNTINHFDPAGNLIRTFGGKGQGPGEIVSLLGVTFHPDGRVGIQDRLSSRIHIFNAYSDTVESWLVPINISGLHLTNREVIVTSFANPPEVGIVMEFYNTESKQLEQFNQLDLIRDDPPPEQVMCTYCRLLFLDDRTFISTQNTPDYLLYRVDPETNEPMTVYSRPDVPPVEFTEAEQQELIEMNMRFTPSMLGGGSADYEPPEYKNRFTNFYADHQERVWALMNVAEGEQPYFDIFSSDGEYIGSKDFPDDATSVGHFYENRILFHYPSDNPDLYKVGLFEIGD